ncbi:hypothetical protein HY212_02000 [Candidatus Pacearchaeota archaeon]|nr:hypothetical protein [Candidatus Pacearchaeota archaeon]
MKKETMEENNNTDIEKQKLEEKRYDKIVLNLFLFLGVLVLFFGIWMFISYKQTHFTYQGVDFAKVKEIAPYRTILKLSYSSGITGNAVKNVEHSFYLRNDPRELEKIPFDGNISKKSIMVFNSKEDFNCNGDGIIGVQNLALLYQALGSKVIKDNNASCNDKEYMLIKIERGNETKIQQIGNACYVMDINSCEILKATERFMTKTFVELKSK